MKKTLICLSILILFLAACTAPGSAPTTKKTESTAAVEPIPKQAAPTKTASSMSQEVKTLLEKHQTIESQEYTRDNGFNTTHVYLKDSKYKIDITSLRESKYGLSEDIDTIYFDKNQETAYAYCADERTFACPAENKNKVHRLNYESEKELIFPLDLIKKIDYAEKVGSATIEGRKTTILEFINTAGSKERLWLDNFFGFVMKQEIYGSSGEVIEKHTFTEISLNKLKDSDVDLPENVQIIG